jgi:hypothetical protein
MLDKQTDHCGISPGEPQDIKALPTPTGDILGTFTVILFFFQP